MRIIALVIASVLLAACGSNPTKTADNIDGKKIDGIGLSQGVAAIATQEGKVDLARDQRVNCEKYKPLGSNRVQYRCFTAAEKKASAKQSQEGMRELSRSAGSLGLPDGPIGH